MQHENLHETAQHLQRIADALEERDGELDEALEKELDSVTMEFEHRLRVLARARDHFEGEERESDYWVQRMMERKRKAASRKEAIERYMVRHMVDTNVLAFETRRDDSIGVINARIALTDARLAFIHGEIDNVEFLKVVEQSINFLGGDGPPVTVKAQQTPGQTIIPDEAIEHLPVACLVPQRPRPDKKLVKQLIEAGEPMPDGVEVRREWKLRIK